mmetsp:Transcript_11508/g.16273  ORF Transcript_11508/g.16273 Transcript_11508/m.16273 type:complete len:386 (-) Transcript_11508:448-1605(-)
MRLDTSFVLLFFGYSTLSLSSLSNAFMTPSYSFVMKNYSKQIDHSHFQTDSKRALLASVTIDADEVTTIETKGYSDNFVPPDTSVIGEISEQACTDASAKMKCVDVPVPSDVSENGKVGISYIHWSADPTAKKAKGSTLPLLMIHGFDSSCLEYRRLGPKLAELGIDTYAVDLLGWGYSQLEGVSSFSARAKVDALKGFWDTIGNGREVCIAGASLGGAAAIEFSASNPDIVRGTVFIDAQGFVDGVGPMASLPKPLAYLGVKVLKSVPLRNSANQMSYYDPQTYATEDALKVGRLHCLRDGWDDALVSFMLSGGFSPSQKVEQITVPSLIMWGRQDGILEKEFAQKFLDTMPDAQLRWVEDCGHVPHLEQPDETAEVISTFFAV